MRRAIPAVLSVALCALAAPAFSVEVHLGAEAARFSLADVPPGLLFLPDWFVPETRTLERLELRELGLGLDASVGPSGKRDRMEARFQRSDDSDGKAVPLPRSGGASNLSVAGRVRLTSLNVVWSRDLTASDRDVRVRSRLGYQYLTVLQTREEGLYLETCADCGYASETRRSTLSGHGLHGGFSASYRIAGPLQLESEAALKFVGAAESESRSGDSDSIAGPRVFAYDAEHGRRGILGWDVAARLRADFSRFGASLGYRLERWGRAGRHLGAQGLGSSGAFAGVSCRLGGPAEPPHRPR